MARPSAKERNNDLYEAILSLKDMDECIAFFDDICAMNELRSIEQRYEVAKMLKDEKVYTEIMQKTNASSATISRKSSRLMTKRLPSSTTSKKFAFRKRAAKKISSLTT